MSSDKSEALNKTVHESHAVEKSKEHQENSFTSEIKHSPHTVRPPGKVYNCQIKVTFVNFEKRFSTMYFLLFFFFELPQKYQESQLKSM